MTCKGFPLALISVPRPQTLVPSEIELFIPAISSGLRISSFPLKIFILLIPFLKELLDDKIV